MSSPARTIHQLVHTLSYGDAISGEVLALQRCFRALGWSSEIYAINVHPRYQGKARDYRELESSFAGEILLHYSLGSPLNDLYRSMNSATRGLVYHNLTPPRWFEGVNPRIVADIKRGIQELPGLCAIADRIIADSNFNAQEIRTLGFEAEVLELPIDPQRWQIETNSGIAALLKGDPGIHVLHVGRLAPNKCIEDIIKAFYFLHHHVAPQSKLWLSGIDIDTELYSFALKRLVYELGLDGAVQFVGALSDGELKALYENATVYLCMSEHEGFCLPVVEAMHFGLPVVAYESSAVVDTVGAGGILVRTKNPAYIGELLNEVSRNQELRSQLIPAGKARVAKLSFEIFERSVGELFTSRRSARAVG